jgi:hypothetical protein
MSPVAGHAGALLRTCESYAEKWKLEFNPKKSVSLTAGHDIDDVKFTMKGVQLPRVDSLTYLGLPISKKPTQDYFDEKMRRVEKAFFSLYGLGCKPKHLSPNSISFIYKQYCQSIFRYGLECLYISKSKLNEYNTRQNILLKQSIGISKYALSTPLLNVLKVEKINEIYFKHKFYFYKQIMSNNLTKSIFLDLSSWYLGKKISKHSFLKQIQEVDLEVGFSCSLEAGKTYLSILENLFKSDRPELCNTLVQKLQELDNSKYWDEKWRVVRDEIALLLFNN